MKKVSRQASLGIVASYLLNANYWSNYWMTIRFLNMPFILLLSTILIKITSKFSRCAAFEHNFNKNSVGIQFSPRHTYNFKGNVY